MENGLHINVSAIDYKTTSNEIATAIRKMQDMIHGDDEFRITDSEFAFGWHFFVVTVNTKAIEKMAALLGDDFQQLKGKGMWKKFITWLEKEIGKDGPRFKMAIKEEMESSKFGIF